METTGSQILTQEDSCLALTTSPAEITRGGKNGSSRLPIYMSIGGDDEDEIVKGISTTDSCRKCAGQLSPSGCFGWLHI